MQPAAPSSSGSRLCPFVRDMTGSRLLDGRAGSSEIDAAESEADGRGHVVERRQGQRARVA